MKFEKVIPKEPWPNEKTQARIDKTMSDISAINKGIETHRKKISQCNHEIRVLSTRLSNKQRYINQLKKQLSGE